MKETIAIENSMMTKQDVEKVVNIPVNEPSKIVCNTCGTEMSIGSTFCSNCGYPLDINSWLPLEELDTPIERTSSAVVTITPEMAEKLLENQSRNRRLKPSALEDLRQALEDDEWELNGETIILDIYGKLIDGQHRLHACIDTNTPITILVVKGVPTEASVTLNGGKKRSTSDQLYICGDKYVTVGGTALRWMCMVDMAEKGCTPNGVPSRTKQIKKRAELNTMFPNGLEGIIEHVSTLPNAGGIFKQLRLTAVVPCYVLFHKENPYAADEFTYRLSSGAGLSEGCPILALRRFGERLVDEKKKSKSGSGIKIYFLMAHIIKAWNAWVNGRQVKRITWNRTKEAFPIVSSVPETFTGNLK